MCTVKAGGLSVEGIDVTKETVIQGTVESGGQPVAGAYVRLLDATGEFTAEQPTSATGAFRFFAAPGTWTVRAISPIGAGQATVAAEGAGVHETVVTL